MPVPLFETLLRLGTAVACGAVIGLEREHQGQPAGLRTHITVALAAAVVMLVAIEYPYHQNYTADDREWLAINPGHIAGGIVTGIGFLGAGTILRVGLTIHGLTTAASLWLVAALGMVAGGGMYAEAGVTTLLSFLTLTSLRLVKSSLGRRLPRQLTLKVAHADAPRDLPDRLTRYRAEVGAIDYEHDVESGTVTFQVDVSFPTEADLQAALAHLGMLPGLRNLALRSRE